MRAKIVMLIELLAENGSALWEPYSKHLVDGIFELRAKVGSDISRVFYFFVIGKRIVLTNGFIKKTQKTPKSEIELAKKYRNEFLNREDK
jgi:phage-related protein